MTTEAEEFKKQEERFDGLAKEFDARFIPDYGLRYDVYRNWPHGHYKASCSMALDGGTLFMYKEFFGKTESEALRTLNDRLELALQGKTKNE